MRCQFLRLALLPFLLCPALNGLADIYVAPNGAHDVANHFNSWEGAATNIHDAVALATVLPGSTVLVSNGLYRLTNTLVVATNMTIRSLNGPEATTLYRPASASQFRLLTLAHSNALVAGITLTNATMSTSMLIGVDISSGTLSNCMVGFCRGVNWNTWAMRVSGGRLTGCTMWSNSAEMGVIQLTGGVVEDCTITSNNAWYNNKSALIQSGGIARRCTLFRNIGGGATVSGGRLENSLVFENSNIADNGGGVTLSGGQLVQCTVVGNRAPNNTGGGVYRTSGGMTNCIVYGNSGVLASDNYLGSAGAAWHSCAPELTGGAQGNISSDPMLVNAAGLDFRLQPGSPCRDSGVTLGGITTDLAGNPRPRSGGSSGGVLYDMGAYEMDGASGGFDIGFYGVLPLSGSGSLDVVFRANAVGDNTNVVWYGWDFNNDGVCELAGAGLATVTNTFGPGRYSVSLWASNTASAAAGCTNFNLVSVVGTDLFAATNGLSLFPYDTWVKAATNVHDALDAALDGCTVQVGPGAFRLTKMIDLFRPVTVRGSAGPQATTLYRDAAAGLFRLLNVRHAGASVSGLTFTNAALSTTQLIGINLDSGTISNCVIDKCVGTGWNTRVVQVNGGLVAGCVVTNCRSEHGVVRVSGGVVEDCVIANNTVWREGALFVESAGVAKRCRMFNNAGSAADSRGGAMLAGGRLENSLFYGNTTMGLGGGVYQTGGQLLNCTIMGNSAPNSIGDGVNRTGGAITNCIIFGNGINSLNDNYSGAASAIAYSCAPELTAGSQGNRVDDPMFVNASARDFRLLPGSPCRDSGAPLAGVTPDLAGVSRPQTGGTRGGSWTDMGAFEMIGTAGDFDIGFFAELPVTGISSLDVVFRANAVGAESAVTWYGWDFNGDGLRDLVGPNMGTVTNTFGPGRYSVVLTASNSVLAGASSTNVNVVSVIGLDLHVATNGAHQFPFDTWAKASTNIHEALDVAVDGCTVHVGPGPFRLTKMIDLFKSVVLSGAGPAATTLYRDAGAGIIGLLNVRHAGARVSGLTWTNASLTTAQLIGFNVDNGMVSNCVFEKCTGAGWMTRILQVNGGVVADCAITNCTSEHGVARVSAGVLQDCVIAKNNVWREGALYVESVGSAKRCRIINNSGSATDSRGGSMLAGGRLENSLLWGNTTKGLGGGVYQTGGVLLNCTIASNSAPNQPGDGVNRTGGSITNCIIYGNSTGALNDNYSGAVSAAASCCAPELTAGSQGNITSDPLFKNLAAGDCRLSPGSPCRNKGWPNSALSAEMDLDRQPRVRQGVVDMGAYEGLPPAGTVMVIR